MKVSIIGLGRMGLRHVQVAQNLGLDLVGLCDANEQALVNASGTLALPSHIFHTDAAAMLAASRPECLVIATTAPSHAALVELAARAGVGMILCEKPMAVSLKACDAMIETCRNAGIRLAINHQMRFMEQYQLPKRLLAEPHFGGLTSVNIQAGNFGIAMNGTHYFEMFRFMTDESPVRVSAHFSKEAVPNPRGPQFEDTAGTVRIETASGRRFYMDCAADQGHGVNAVYMARNGRITIDELAGELVAVVRQGEHSALPTTRYGMPIETERLDITPADAVAPSAAVLSALIAGKDYPTGEDGRSAMEVLIAAHLSHQRSGAVVAIGPELPRDLALPIA